MVAVTKQHQLKKRVFLLQHFLLPFTIPRLYKLGYTILHYHLACHQSSVKSIFLFFFFYFSSVRFFLYLGQQLFKKSLTFFFLVSFFCSLRGPFLRALHKRSFSSCTSLFFLFNWNALIAFIFHKI